MSFRSDLFFTSTVGIDDGNNSTSLPPFDSWTNLTMALSIANMTSEPTTTASLYGEFPISISNISAGDNATMVEAAPPLSIPQAATFYLSYKVGLTVHAYYLPIIIFLGLIGNCFSLAIMLLPHNRRIGCCNYIAALSVSDNLMLINALDYWTVAFESRPVYNLECRIMAWLFQAGPFASMVFLFSMTVDRFLAIRYPLQSRIWCSPRRARITIACTWVIVLLYTLPYFFTSGFHFQSRSCLAVKTKDKLSSAYNWLNIFLGSIVPFFGLLGMNAAIIYTIRRRGKYFSKNDKSNSKSEKSVEVSTISGTKNRSMDTITTSDNDDGIDADNLSVTTNDVQTNGSINMGPESKTKAPVPKQMSASSESEDDNAINNSVKNIKKGSQKKTASLKNSRSSRENQLTVMLLLVTFTFLVLTLPQYARYLIAILWDYGKSAEGLAYYIMIAHLTNKLFYTNNACNFLLYCLSGSKFRQDFLSLFKRKKKYNTR